MVDFCRAPGESQVAGARAGQPHGHCSAVGAPLQASQVIHAPQRAGKGGRALGRMRNRELAKEEVYPLLSTAEMKLVISTEKQRGPQQAHSRETQKHQD